MKPLPKLLMPLAAVAMLAFSHNASAVTILGFNGSDPHALGGASPNAPAPSFSDADKTALVNHLIGQALNTNDTVSLGPQQYDVHRFGNDFGPLPGPAVIGPSGTNTNITIGSGLYSYLFATYTRDGFTTGFVWYIGNLSGDVTIPATEGGYNLIGWTLFGPGGQGVPDGGTTVMLLGAALGALGMARRFLKA
jgi:hypothetical protein